MLKGAVKLYLEIVCLGQVRPLKSGQVRSLAKLVPHLHKLFANVFQITYFVKGVHIMDPKYLRVHI